MIIGWSLLHHCFYAGCTPKKVAWFQKWWPSNAILKILELMVFKTEKTGHVFTEGIHNHHHHCWWARRRRPRNSLGKFWKRKRKSPNSKFHHLRSLNHCASLKPQQTSQLTVVFSDVKFSCVCRPADHVVCLLGYILHYLRGLFFARTTPNNFTWISWNRFKILICQNLKSISGFNWGY